MNALLAEDQSAFTGPPIESNRDEPILLDISPESFLAAFSRHRGFFVSLFHLMSCISNGFMGITEFFEKDRTIESLVVLENN